MADASEVAVASVEVQMSASRAESALVADKPVDWAELDAAVDALKAFSVTVPEAHSPE